MIKIIIKESKVLKTANEDTLQAINDFVVSSKHSNTENKKIFNINISELLYLDKTKLLGLPYFYYYHILNASLPKNIEEFWDKQNNIFVDKFLSDIKDKLLPITVKTSNDTREKAIAKAGAATKDNKSVFLMIAYLNNINPNTFKNKVAHEFRHFTQRANDICIYYGEQLKKLKDPSKVEMINIQNIPNKSGLGRDITGILKTTSKKDVFATAAGDIEYETYLADLIESYFSRLMKSPEALKSDITSLGVNGAAVKYTKLLFNVYRHKSSYANINGIIQKILETRPEEFPKDVLSLLTNKFSSL